MNFNIYIESKRKSLENISRKYPNAKIFDVTSKGKEYLKFSPFYPHGNIPVPFSHNYYSQSVEGIWQGLKVFENHQIDMSKFMITNMKGIKRTIRTCGKILGHRKGVLGNEILGYTDAKRDIYLPSYKWVLENKLVKEIQKLKLILEKNDLILLDYETNLEIFNIKPISHANLIRLFILNKYPQLKTNEP